MEIVILYKKIDKKVNISQTLVYHCFNGCRIPQNIESNRSKGSERTSANKDHWSELDEVEKLASWWENSGNISTVTLWKEFFWSEFSRIRTKYGEISVYLRIHSECGKIGISKTTNTDTFHAMGTITSFLTNIMINAFLFKIFTEMSFYFLNIFKLRKIKINCLVMFLSPCLNNKYLPVSSSPYSATIP